MTASQTRRAADKLDNAFACYARDNGDGFSDHDFQGAYDYREEGFRIGEAAFDMSAEDREDWIEVESYAFPESARYLIGCAADFRVAELGAEEARSANAAKAALYLASAA